MPNIKYYYVKQNFEDHGKVHESLTHYDESKLECTHYHFNYSKNGANQSLQKFILNDKITKKEIQQFNLKSITESQYNETLERIKSNLF